MWPQELRKYYDDSHVFKPDFYIFSYNEQLRKIYWNFIDKFVLFYTFITL